MTGRIDSGARTADIVVVLKLIDGPDQPPKFSSSTYTLRIAEDTGINTLINRQETIRAEDQDVDLKWSISYQIQNVKCCNVECTENELILDINSNSGELITKREFNAECSQDQPVFYEFIVIATERPSGDFGQFISNPMTSEARIQLEILDINDNPPFIQIIKDFDDQKFEIEENRGAGSLLRGPKIIVNDLDSAYSNSKWFVLVVNNATCPVESLPEEGFRSQEIKLRTRADFDFEKTTF